MLSRLSVLPRRQLPLFTTVSRLHTSLPRHQDQKTAAFSFDQNATKVPEKGRANEIIEAVLYGSKRVKEEDSQTHSKMLARGKYVHELQKHKVKPDKVEEYIQLVTAHFPRIANDPLNDVHLCGSWSVEIGELDTF
ncbi:hypothetical protein DFQ30_002595, partial [Apophysomyces sp. BC1015]